MGPSFTLIQEASWKIMILKSIHVASLHPLIMALGHWTRKCETQIILMQDNRRKRFNFAKKLSLSVCFHFKTPIKARLAEVRIRSLSNLQQNITLESGFAVDVVF
jgi:hypothetical protein